MAGFLFGENHGHRRDIIVLKLHMRHVHHHNKSLILYTICFIGFVFTLHSALPVYINSTFLSQFTTEAIVGAIYFISSFISIAGLALINPLLRKFGNYQVSTWLLVMQIACLAGLIVSQNIYFIVPFFLIHIALNHLVGFTIDIFLESNSDNTHTGGIRGLFLTAVNIAWILSPLLASSLIGTDDYWKLYAAGIGLALPLFYLLRKNFKKFKDPQYPATSFFSTLRRVWHNENYYYILATNIVLNTFYSWMVIYTPIYLHQHIGFDWDIIGIIFTIMLLPFALFQYPLGKLADNKYGEKEILAIGFIIMGVSTIALSFIEGANVWFWAALLFLTRVGASVAEIMIETYFFKQIHTKDSNILSMFRITRPIAYFISPVITVAGLIFFDLKYIFALLGCVVLAGLYYIFNLKDTN